MTLTPLRLSLLVAICVHLLALAGWQFLRNRQAPVSRLEAPDDTPVLLQFSRQPTLIQDQNPIPLPPASPLPLPIGAEAAAATRSGAQTSGAGPSRRAPSAASLARKGSGTPADGTTSRRRGDLRASISKTPEMGGRTDPVPLALGPGTPARGALINLFHQLGPSHASEASESERGEARSADSPFDSTETASGTTQDLTNRGPGTGTIESKATAADTRLWALARIPRTPPSGLEGLPGQLSIRHLPLREARRSGTQLSHRRVVRLEDGALLLWIDGGTLWLLRAALP